MNLKNLILISATVVIVAVAAGSAFGEIGFGLVILLFLSALLAWLVNEYVWVRVAEMETAVTFNVETKAFRRFLPAGRHWLAFPVERRVATVSIAPAAVKGRCRQAQTEEGVTVSVEWSLSYQVNPLKIDPALRPRLARLLPEGPAALVRNHVNNCMAALINQKRVAALFQNGRRGPFEQELTRFIQKRLAPFGIEVFRLMVTAVDLPASVQAALEEAHEREVYAASEANSLARLHEVVSKFSDADMERLLKLEQLREMGQHGVALHVPLMTALPTTPRRQKPANGKAENGRLHTETLTEYPGQNRDGRSYVG